MNYLEKYAKRLNDGGANSKDAYINQSKIIAKQQIMDSPNLHNVYLNRDETVTHYCIARDKGNYEKRKFIFVPDTVVNLGDYVTQDTLVYLLTGKDTNDITPQFIGDFCSAEFPVKYADQKIEIGTDNLGRPIYDIIPGEIKELPCVVKMNNASTAIADTNEPINLLDNQVVVTIPYTEAPSIKYNEKFELYNDLYRIIRIDPSSSINKVGILHITGQRVESVGDVE